GRKGGVEGRKGGGGPRPQMAARTATSRAAGARYAQLRPDDGTRSLLARYERTGGSPPVGRRPLAQGRGSSSSSRNRLSVCGTVRSARSACARAPPPVRARLAR